MAQQKEKKEEQKKTSPRESRKIRKQKNAPSEVRARLRYLRMSPRKVRFVANVIRGMDVEEALDHLRAIKKAAREPIIKLIQSGIANAQHNYQLEKKVLYIKSIRVDGGPTLKRWHPRAHGRAGMIRKRTSHIFLLLGVKK